MVTFLKAYCLIYLIIQAGLWMVRDSSDSGCYTTAEKIGGYLGNFIGSFTWGLIIWLFIANVF